MAANYLKKNGGGYKMNKKIYRSQKDKMLGGVCGGIAEYFNIDSTIVRLLAILLFFAEGIGVFLYFACWIIIPEAPSSGSYSFNDGNADNAYSDDKGFSTDEAAKPDTGNGQKIIGFGLIALGLIILIDKWIPYFHWRRFWPLILVGFGAVLVLKGVKDNE